MEQGFSMSFLDVLSLGLIGVIILYVTTVNTNQDDIELEETYYITIETDSIPNGSIDRIIINESSRQGYTSKISTYANEPSRSLFRGIDVDLDTLKKYALRDYHMDIKIETEGAKERVTLAITPSTKKNRFSIFLRNIQESNISIKYIVDNIEIDKVCNTRIVGIDFLGGTNYKINNCR